MSHEWHKRYRPKTFRAMVGNEQAVAMLKDMERKSTFPHTLLFTGPSGCGKTTLARIVADKLGCGEYDTYEVNCGVIEKPIDSVREIQSQMRLAAMSGGNKIWILDEVQALSRAKFAQQALLKILEDTPNHVYFALCTNEPHKLLKPILTRATEIKVKTLTPKQMEGLLNSVAKKEKVKLTQDVTDRIIEVSEGSPRKALVILEQIAGIEDEEERLNAILSTDARRTGFDIAKELIFGRDWKKVQRMLKEYDDDAEAARRVILGFASAMLLSNNVRSYKRAFLTLNAFRDDFYNIGKPGLVLACFEVFHGS